MRRAVVASLAIVVALALAGCAGSDDQSAAGDETPTTSSAPSASADDSDGGSTDDSAGTVVEIRIQGDTIEPQGKSIEVDAGEPITLEVTSDRAAELHVHSSPEQELEVDEGETSLPLTLSTPGVVDVEEHESGVVVLRLEVR